MVITWPIANFELGIGVIQNYQLVILSPIGHFITNWFFPTCNIYSSQIPYPKSPIPNKKNTNPKYKITNCFFFFHQMVIFTFSFLLYCCFKKLNYGIGGNKLQGQLCFSSFKVTAHFCTSGLWISSGSYGSQDDIWSVSSNTQYLVRSGIWSGEFTTGTLEYLVIHDERQK